jgi:hypothetical protein
MHRSLLRRPWFWLLGIFVVVLGAALWNNRFGVPDDYDRMEAQYKYGSIGSDHPLAQAPIPYWLWKVLPDLFDPATVIPDKLGPRNGKPGFAAFGLVTEDNPERPRGWVAGQPGFDRPIGFSRRRVFGMDFVGLNCAFCHLGTFSPDGGKTHQVVLGGTGQNVDIEQYFLYLFSTLTSPELKADRVMNQIDKELAKQKAELGWVQRALYRYVLIPLLPAYLKHMEREKFDFIMPNNPNRLPEFGPGRVDTWGLYKRVFIDPPAPDSIAGTVDFPSLWNQKARAGMRMHWDGNTDVLVERNIVSALSIVGRRIEYLDFERLTRVTDWIEGLLPMRYADHAPAGLRGKDAQGNNLPPIDMALAAQGSTLFDRHCGSCHAPQGDRVGRVEPISDLGTDPERIAEFTPALADALNRLGTKQWQLRHFRLQNGYVNNLLDGLWLRAPYLHNGSVPTLRDLLNKQELRPKQFCRGGDVYDWVNLGYVSATTAGADGKPHCPTSYRYDTTVRGNSNGGHLYGTYLSDAEKNALLEFLKTL